MRLNSSFVMETDAPYTLNYLVYLQNAYLNRNTASSDWVKFPHADLASWNLAEEELFCHHFRRIWNAAAHNLATNRHYDHSGTLHKEEELFLPLFQQGELGLTGFYQSRQSFLAWWDSLAGKMAVGSFAHRQMDGIYEKLAYLLENSGIPSNNRLVISFVYDQFPLAGTSTLPWYTVLSIEDVLLRKDELHVRLFSCCDQP